MSAVAELVGCVAAPQVVLILVDCLGPAEADSLARRLADHSVAVLAAWRWAWAGLLRADCLVPADYFPGDSLPVGCSGWAQARSFDWLAQREQADHSVAAPAVWRWAWAGLFRADCLVPADYFPGDSLPVGCSGWAQARLVDWPAQRKAVGRYVVEPERQDL